MTVWLHAKHRHSRAWLLIGMTLALVTAARLFPLMRTFSKTGPLTIRIAWQLFGAPARRSFTT